MLKSLRNNTGNRIIKLILILIILSFVLYFGSSSLRSQGMNAGVAATVNDEPINMQKVMFIASSKLNEITKGKDTAMQNEFASFIKNSVIENLITEELVHQALNEYGLKISTPELIERIKTNPQFIRDGKFDKNFYTNNFLPYYQQKNGSSFENDIKKEIAFQKLVDMFSEVITLTDSELNKLHSIMNTKYTLDFIKVPVNQKENNTTDKTKKETIAPQDLANNILTEWQQGNDIESLIKENKLSKSTTPELTYPRLKTIFGGKADVNNIKKIALLTEKAPYVTPVIKEGNYYYIIKLTQLLKPSEKPTEEELTTLKEAYQDEFSMSLESAFIKELRAQAKIKKMVGSR